MDLIIKIVPEYPKRDAYVQKGILMTIPYNQNAKYVIKNVKLVKK